MQSRLLANKQDPVHKLSLEITPPDLPSNQKKAWLTDNR